MKKVLAVLLVICLCVGALSFTASAAGSTTAAAEAYEVGYAKVDINPYWHEWVEWSNASTGNIPDGIRGTIPYADFYDEYDMLPLPMGGYGNNAYRLSRAKLMDDNGSGVGASKTNVTNTSRYYKKSNGTYAKASSTGHYTALYIRSGSSTTGYTYTKDTNYQDVHLSSNRYTQAFAAQMGVTYADGIYGENDGDGVWATCVLVKDPQSNSPLLMIGVDIIGVQDAVVNSIKKAILAQPAIQAIGLTEDRILVNTNHTHGSVDLRTSYSSTNTTTLYTLAEGALEDEQYTFTSQQLYWYLSFYQNHLCNQLAEAAAQAAGDLEVAKTMEKGSIDASDQTGYQLNGVRHNVQTYYGSPEITYVRGSSFNNDMDLNGSNDSHTGSNSKFSKSIPVSESDDSLHVLKFTFENKEPIVMVNFRAHSTANNKQAAKLLHYNISSDWVSPLRYELEKAGYRFSLLYGSSGNLGMGLSNRDNDVIPHNYANYNTTAKRWELPATPHGYQLTQATLALLGDVAEKNDSIITDMHSVPMGKIQSLRTNYVLAKHEWSPLAYAAALTYYNSGSPTYGGRYTIADGETVSYTNSSGKTVTITLGEGEGGTFVVASKYHANGIKSKYETKGVESIELNAILMGSQVAFATTPVESSDRYSSKEIAGDSQIITNGVSNYNENDWDKLNNADAWGTPFVLSLTNGAHGYVPNQLAYDYGIDYTGTDYMVARGSYESHTAWANRGEGEKMVETLSNMLHSVEPVVRTCAHCGAKQTWYPLSTAKIDKNKSYTLPAGHYYLASDFDYSSYVRITAGTQVCLDLNGYTYSAESYGAASRAFNLYGTLNVQDSSENQTGKIQGYGVKWSTSTAFSAGTVIVNNTGILNLYSGSLTMNHVEGYGPKYGGVLSVSGTFNMYGGAVYGGIADNGVANTTGRNGGNIYISGGTFNMHGGRVYDGTAANYGGNLYIASGKANLLGGTMEGGAAENGANIYTAGGTLTINGANVLGGVATGNGGTLYTAGGTVKLENGTVGGGTAVKGGGVYLARAITLTGGSISGGTAENGGALYVAEGISQTLNGTNIQGGNAQNGGSVYLPEGATLTTGATTTISGGSAINGGCVYMGGTLALTEGATITAGTAENGGNIYLPEGKTLQTVQGVSITDGKATNGGNVYIAGGTLPLINGFTLSGGEATSGGNVYLAGGTLTLSDDYILSGGSATNGGNLYIAPQASFTLTAGTINGNVYTDGTLQLEGGNIAGQVMAKGGTVLIQNGAKVAAENGGLTIDGAAVILADDLAAGTEVYISDGAGNEAGLTVANTQAAAYLEAGYIKTAEAARPAMVNADNQIYIIFIESVVRPCAHCGTEQTWYALNPIYIDKNNSNNLTAGHYYLTGNTKNTFYVRISAGVQVCLDLNGYTYSAESYGAASRAFNLYGTLNVQDSSENQTGKIQGYGVKWSTSTAFSAGTVIVNNTGILNLYSGSLTMNHVEGYGPKYGGVLSVSGTFNMYGGAVYGGIADNGVANATGRNGGNIYISGGTFNMYGGRVYDGTAANHGGNLYVGSGTANLLGGTMEGGTAEDGGNIYTAGGTLIVNGTNVLGGTATGNGGTLYTAGGTVKLENGTVGGGTAVNGGGVYLARAITLTGGSVSGGTAENGGALYVAEGISQTLNGTNIQGGEAQSGGSVYLPEGATLTTGVTTTISGGNAQNGGNVYLVGGNLNLCDGASISGGEATNGGNVYLAGGALHLINGFTLSGGEATNGGNVYLADGTLTVPSGYTLSGGNATNGGNVYVAGGNLNLCDGGSISGGSATNGGNLYIAAQTGFTMTAGTVTGGDATCGGNVYVPADAQWILSGATVTGGTAENGGNVFVASDGTFTMNSGCVNSGTATSAGGNLCVAGGAVNLLGGTVEDGEAICGGNVYIVDGALNLADGITLSGGNATSGGNVYLAGGNVNLPGGAALSGGEATNGGNLYISGGALALAEGAALSGGTAENGGNVYVAGGALTLVNGVTLTGGEATSGGNVYLAGGTLTVPSGYTLSGGKATSGGNVYIAGGNLNLCEGASISGGEAQSGGNLYIAPQTSCTLTAGTIGGDVYVPAEAELILSGATVTGGDIHTDGTLYAEGGSIGGNLYIHSGNAYLRGGNITGQVMAEGGTVHIHNGAKVAAENGGLTIDGAAVILADDLAAGTEVYISDGAGNETGLTVANTQAAAYLEAGYIKSANAARPAMVNADHQIYIIFIESVVRPCVHCGTEQTWYALNSIYIDKNNSYNLRAGHYYLDSDFKYNSYVRISTGVQVCLDLNGYTYSAESYSAASRAFNLYGTLNVQDSSESQTGKIQGYGVKWSTSTAFSGGTIIIGNAGTLNLYSGSLTMNHVKGYGPKNGGVLSISGAFNMYGGAVYGGIADNGVANATGRNGGNIYISGGTFNMHGGRVYDGTAANYGGNLYISGGKVNLLGGTMEGGAAENGANIYTAGGTLIMNGTNVLGGVATGNGGTLYTAGGTVKLQSGTVGGGTATNGGSVCLARAITLTGGSISGGTAENGGALYVAEGISQTLNGTSIQDGEATNGGNVYLAGGTLTVPSGYTLSGGKATSGGNVYIAGGNLNMSEGASISGGEATYGGNLYIAPQTSCTLPAGTIGGDVYVPADAQLILSGATVTGGDVHTDGTLYAEGGSIGGNLYIHSGNAYLRGGNITGQVMAEGGTVHIQNGAKVAAENGGLTIDGAAVILADDLAAGTEVYISDGAGNEAGLTVANTQAAAYVEAGYIKTMDTAKRIVVNADGQILIVALEAVADVLNGILNVSTTEVKAWCPVCDQMATWVPLSATMDALDTGAYTHYYLAQDITRTDSGCYRTSIDGSTICIHLNGKTYDQGTSEDVQGAIQAKAKTTINILDCAENTGTVIGAGLKYDENQNSSNPNWLYGGGAIDARGTVNIYGGTFMTNRKDRPAVATFGYVDVSVINMYGGRIIRNEAVVTTTGSSLSSLVRMHYKTHTFNMYGGEISGGMAQNGGNVRLQGGGNFNLFGGTITGGSSANLGGNICNRGGVFTMTGGTVTAGTTAASGGSFGLVSGTTNIQGGVIDGGSAVTGGLIYVYGGTLHITGGELKNGTGTGGSVMIAGGTNTITGGTFTGGMLSNKTPRQITVKADTTLTLGNNVEVDKIYVSGTVIVENGTVATLELASTGRVALAADVADGTKINVIATATRTIANMENAADYLSYFETSVAGATIAVKDGTTNVIQLVIPAK